MRPEVEIPDLPFYFKSSLRYGLSSLDTLVRESAAEMGLDTSEVRAYLTRTSPSSCATRRSRGSRSSTAAPTSHGMILEPRPIEFWK